MIPASSSSLRVEVGTGESKQCAQGLFAQAPKMVTVTGQDRWRLQTAEAKRLLLYVPNKGWNERAEPFEGVIVMMISSTVEEILNRYI